MNEYLPELGEFLLRLIYDKDHNEAKKALLEHISFYKDDEIYYFREPFEALKDLEDKGYVKLNPASSDKLYLFRVLPKSRNYFELKEKSLKQTLCASLEKRAQQSSPP